MSSKQQRLAGRTMMIGNRRVPREIAALFEQYALEVAAAGHRRYSSRGVAERIRWHTMVERKDRAFKFNNNHAAPLARWFLARHPELPAFFELREQRMHDA